MATSSAKTRRKANEPPDGVDWSAHPAVPPMTMKDQKLIHDLMERAWFTHNAVVCCRGIVVDVMERVTKYPFVLATIPKADRTAFAQSLGDALRLITVAEQTVREFTEDGLCNTLVELHEGGCLDRIIEALTREDYQEEAKRLADELKNGERDVREHMAKQRRRRSKGGAA